MQELKNALLKEMGEAMKVVSNKALADMREETEGFYTGKEPKVYQRTGELGNTPQITDVTRGGNEVSFEAYLNAEGSYTTGKKPTMLDVLNLADKGITNSSVGRLRHTIGKRGFWERAEKKIEKDFNSTMSLYFD